MTRKIAIDKNDIIECNVIPNPEGIFTFNCKKRRTSFLKGKKSQEEELDKFEYIVGNGTFIARTKNDGTPMLKFSLKKSEKCSMIKDFPIPKKGRTTLSLVCPT